MCGFSNLPDLLMYHCYRVSYNSSIFSASLSSCAASSDPCVGSLCENGGVCEEIGGGYDYYCSCDNLGYTGVFCETDIGESSDCLPSNHNLSIMSLLSLCHNMSRLSSLPRNAVYSDRAPRCAYT